MLNTLELQTLQVKLYQASLSKKLRTKQEAMVYYKTKIGNSLDEQHESIFKNIARQNGVYPTDYKISFYSMNEFEVDLHLQAAAAYGRPEVRQVPRWYQKHSSDSRR